MQKKCKKIQKLLHMSKKSSTFASDLGIVPTTTNKYNRVMNDKTICKMQFGGKIYRIVEREEIGGRWREYRLMCGRKRIEGVCDFSTSRAAYDVFEDIMRNMFMDELERGRI